MEPSTPLNGRLLDMKQRLVRMMPDRIAAITSTLSGYGDGGGDVTALLERQFHTLAGTAGTYDLDALAAAAFEGEQACVELGKSPHDGGDVPYLAFLISQLHHALAVDAARQPNGIRTLEETHA
jgi:HPt (histidine-containing phosphotransfer) domain-containing protein